MEKKWKTILITILISLGGFLIYIIFEDSPDGTKKPASQIVNELVEETIKPRVRGEESYFSKLEVINILLIGKDNGVERKSNGQRGYNTDTLILLSINPKKNKVLLTSFPRDIWQNNSKINGILITQGMDSLLDAISKISGQKVEKYIAIDFDGFRWLINQSKGVGVEVETSFVDNTFPNNEDTAIKTVSFVKGVEIMDGERALTFARSRKGNNGEGSDLKRGKRQHQILKGMIKTIQKEDSNFYPFSIEDFYNKVIKNLETNVLLDDAYFIFSFYVNINEYLIQSLVLDDRYIYHPQNSAPYGGAWVFIANEPGFKSLHTDINDFLLKDVNLLNTQ